MNQDLYLHGLIGGTSAAEPTWTRPTDWIAVPDLLPEDDKIYLLNHIKPNTTTNYIAFICTGNYTVDWGDGNTENVASGVKAQHQYDFDTITSDLTLDGFKQVITTITPNGGSLLTVSFDCKHNEIVVPYLSANNPIELKINCPSMTDLAINGYWYSIGYLTFLTRLVIGEHNLNNTTGILNGNSPGTLDGYFAYLPNLKEVVLGGSYNLITSVNSMFQACRVLTNFIVPDTSLDWSSCTYFGFMFDSCYNLKSDQLPLLDTSGGLNFTCMFTGCYSIETVPHFNTISATDMSYMFRNCYALAVVPEFNTSSVTDMSNMFLNTNRLSILPNFDTSSVTDMTEIFSGSSESIQAKSKISPSWNLTSISANATMPTINYGNVTTVNFTNIKHNFNVAGCLLDRDNIVNVFNNLATVVGKTVTVSGNPGVPNLTTGDLLIATSKGWTVVT